MVWFYHCCWRVPPQVWFRRKITWNMAWTCPFPSITAKSVTIMPGCPTMWIPPFLHRTATRTWWCNLCQAGKNCTKTLSRRAKTPLVARGHDAVWPSKIGLIWVYGSRRVCRCVYLLCWLCVVLHNQSTLSWPRCRVFWTKPSNSPCFLFPLLSTKRFIRPLLHWLTLNNNLHHHHKPHG